MSSQLLLALFLLLFFVLVLRNAWIGDDALITLRTVRNFNEGYGLVWNIHERVQSYTHPLWMLLLSATYFITTETYFSTIAVSVILSVASALFISIKIARTTIGALLALLLLMLSKAFMDYTTSGLENPLTYLLFTLFFYIYIDEGAFSGRAKHRQFLWLTLVASLGVTNRMDTVVIFAPALFYRFYQLYSWRALWTLVVGNAPFLLWTCFAVIYYGFPFPNTAYAKLGAQIERLELFEQGAYYFIDSLSVDPITLVMIGVAFIFAIVVQELRLGVIALGIILYLAYIVYIGGDFMSGRFFSTPYLGAILLLSQQRDLLSNDLRTYLLMFGIVVIGMLNPPQSPILSNSDYSRVEIGANGIADERGHYYPNWGLANSTRQNRLAVGSHLRGNNSPQTFLSCGAMGRFGLSSSPYTHVVDVCGLTDAFIARLPSMYNPQWRPGHIVRWVPPDYLGTLRTGNNQISDPNLQLFYTKLTTVTQGEIWSRERFMEIWRFNTGVYNHLLDEEKLRFPHIEELIIEEQNNNGGGLIDAQLFLMDDVEIKIRDQGVRLLLDSVRHPTHLDIGIDSNYMEIVYFLDDKEVGSQAVAATPYTLGDRAYSVVQVPRTVTAQGFDQVRISQRNTNSNLLRYVSLVNLRGHSPELEVAELSSMELRQALQLYYYIFYQHAVSQAEHHHRVSLLSELHARLEKAPSVVWSSVSQDILFDLLAMPAPAFQRILMPQLENDVLLFDTTGTPKLRYIGQKESETIEIDDRSILQLNLYFLVEGSLEREYSAWFGIKQSVGESDSISGSDSNNDESVEYREWIVYDEFPEFPTQKWGQGTIMLFEPKILLPPGTYEFTFGFWTPHDRERLYVDPEHDVYWIDLGRQIVESEP